MRRARLARVLDRHEPEAWGVQLARAAAALFCLLAWGALVVAWGRLIHGAF